MDAAAPAGIGFGLEVRTVGITRCGLVMVVGVDMGAATTFTPWPCTGLRPRGPSEATLRTRGTTVVGEAGCPLLLPTDAA